MVASAEPPSMDWFEVFWPRPLTEEVAARVMRGWASDQRSPVVVLEAHAEAGIVRYLLGSPSTDSGVVRAVLTGLCPGVLLALDTKRPTPALAGRLKATTRHRALATDNLTERSRHVLAALAGTRRGESLTLQVVLGPRRVPLAIPNHSPSSVVMPWWQVAWQGNGGQIDGEKRSALRAKVSEHGFASTIRLGALAPTQRRRELLVLGLMAALRGAEAPGIHLRLQREPGKRLRGALAPWRWPLRLGVHEVLALTGWPIAAPGDDNLPGLPAPHPRSLAPAPNASKSGRVLARASAPGATGVLLLTMADQLHHLHVIGPTGTGKSTLLGRLVLQDLAEGRGAVVIDPKGDLVDDILTRLPRSRAKDVVVLDPADVIAPVGFNPLAARPRRRPEVVADALLAVFHDLWADAWGPRTQDILHAGLLTLTRRADVSLVMLPLLLTNSGFRRSLTQRAIKEDPVALGSFWAWYERLGDAERAAVIAPVMNKLRAFLLRPSMRAVLGQVTPAFSMSQVFTEGKVLLVSLSKGLVGPEAAALLGSLVVAELWQSTLERAAVPAAERRPVHVVIDEVQEYLHLPTDLADALAQARGLGVGFTLAHQYLDQLPRAMQAAVLANARSRVCFQLPPSDAAVLAKGHPELTAEDFTALGRYEVYASLLSGGQANPYVSGRTEPLPKIRRAATQLRERSRLTWGRAPSSVEASIAALSEQSGVSGAPTGRRRVGGDS